MSQPNIIKVGSYTYSDADIIGKGSFGKVYRGKNKYGGVVAIKIIYVESNKQNSLIRMIKNEVEALKKSKSEHVVQFYDFIVQNNNVHIITEYCNQKDLRHYLAKHKILEEKKAVEFLKQITAAFKELCRRQVFHRDLKPANVLLNDGVCKIADFGFAKTLDFSVTDYNTHMVSIVGTPLYMSPQLLDKQKYTTKSDIWSLGIIFYEMLFGRVPWAGKDPATYSKNIKSQPLTIMHDVNPISPEAEDFLTQCLKVSEEERIGWTELFNHPLISGDINSARSMKDDSKAEDFAEFLTAESRIKSYNRGPVNPSSLMKLYQNKAIAASKGPTDSQLELTKTTIDQKLKGIAHFGFSQSRINATTTPHSRTFNMSVNDDAKNGDITKSYNRLKSNGPLLKDSRELSPSPDRTTGKSFGFGKKHSDEAVEEFKKIERPLIIMKNKLTVLSDLHHTVTMSEEFKELPAIKFNFLITISKLINVIFKNLASQVLTKKVKTRSHLLSDYLETDNFKRIIAFVETNKKKYDEMLKTCSRKLFELNLPSDKEKDEVLDYYQEVLAESEDQVLLGKLVDMANQMLYQIRFSSQIYKRSVAAGTNQIIESVNPNAVTKEYFEGLLALFGEESIIDTFKYDKIDEILSKVERLREETRNRL